MPRLKNFYLLFPLFLFFISSLFVVTNSAFAANATYPPGFAENVYTSGLTQPTKMRFASDGRLFVSEKGGTMRIVKNGQLLSTPFLTVSVNTNLERGLMGFDFDPDFANNHFIYVYYTRATIPIKNRLSRFTVSVNNSDIVDPNSELILIDNIGSDSGMHNSGHVQFGPDGKLYITVGDGGQTSTNAQDLTNLSGKVLRINKDGSIPLDNPFVNTPGARGEIWAYGFRNPFTYDFNMNTGQLFVNDVGNNVWEEIDNVVKGGDYGWPNCEGKCNPANPKFTDPIWQNYHPIAEAITGGAFYNATRFPSQYNHMYFFGDYPRNYIHTLDYTNGNVEAPFGINTNTPVDIKIGPDGALYYLSIANGAVYRVDYVGLNVSPTPVPSTSPTPTQTTGDGLHATYFSTINLTGNSISRTDSTINFDWGQGSPDPAIQSDNFSARWTGTILPQFTELYTFYARSDDGARVWVDDKLVIDNWKDQPATEVSGVIHLTAGMRTNIKVEYYEHMWAAVSQLSWSSPSTPKQIIPQSQLFTSSDPTSLGSMTSPTQGTTYNAGDTITYSGNANDSVTGNPLPETAFSWTMEFHHLDHIHPFIGPVNGVKGGTFQTPAIGEESTDTWIRILMTVTDSNNVKHTTFRDIFPNIVTLSLNSVPQGIQVTLDGQPQTTPLTFTSVVNHQRIIGASSSQTLNGMWYSFVSWSDNGAATHTITTPNTNTNYTVTFQQAGITPSVTISPIPSISPSLSPSPTPPILIGNGLLGSYFQNQNFSGNVVQQIDPTINFDWGTGQPVNGIGPTNFSIRWTGKILPPTDGTYTFYARTDDGARVWVDDKLVIDNWIDQAANEVSGTINLTGGKAVNIRVDYYQNQWADVAQLSWSGPNIAKQIIPQSVLFSNPAQIGDGLTGIYYPNQNFTGVPIVRIDPTVAFDWGQGSPMNGIGTDHFSVRWIGMIKPQFNEHYTFYARADDGVRVWVDDKLIIDHFVDQPATEWLGNILLNAGTKYLIKVEYYENMWAAVAQLSWSSPSTPKQIIPQANLFSY